MTNQQNTESHEQINTNDFQLTLSVSTKSVTTKEDGKTIKDFIDKTIDTKDDGALEQLLTSRPYSTNHWNGPCKNENYVGMTGVTFDFDHGTTIDEAKALFEPFNYVLHTTASHQTEETKEDRFRVILPFADDSLRYVTELESRKVYYKLLTLYPDADSTCRNPGRKFFPHTPEFHAEFVLHVNKTGTYFDVNIDDIPDKIVEVFERENTWDGKFRPKRELERVLKHCPFVNWMKDNIGKRDIKIREPLKYALISNLCLFDGGRKAIHDILSRDARPWKYDWAKIDAKIDNALANGGPHRYSTIKGLGWTGEVPDWPASPAGWGRFVDLDGLLAYLKTLNGRARTDALIQHFVEDFYTLSTERQATWLSQLAQELQIKLEKLEALALSVRDRLDYKTLDLQPILVKMKLLGASPEEIGQVVFVWLSENGCKFYRDRLNKGYWIYDGTVYEVGTNQPFNTLVWRLTGLTHEGIDSRKVWAVLKAETDSKGILLKSFTWLHTDATKNQIYLNLNLEDGRIIRIDRDAVNLIGNGFNEESIFLAPSSKMLPTTLVRMDTQTWEDTIRLFDELVLRNMACSRNDQLLYGCWALTYPLIGFVKVFPHFRCEGSSSAGKTRATELISHFIYGDSQIKRATVAANYADGMRNPLILLDNVEEAHFNQGLGDFTLGAVTGVSKEKRQLGTDSDVVLEKVHCLLNTNGIEPLGKTEHINRMFAVRFDRWKYGSKGWSERVYARITSERPRLLTAHLLLISKVLGGIEDGRLEFWQDYLATTFPDHSKDRSNSFIALMAIILEELMAVLDPSIDVKDILSDWITSQDADGRHAMVHTHPILQLLEAIAEQGRASSDSLRQDFARLGYEVDYDLGKITGTASQLHNTFSAVAKHKRLIYEYKSPLTLARRITDFVRSLTKEGGNQGDDEAGEIVTPVFKLTKYKNRNGSLVYTFDLYHGSGLD